MPEQDVVDYAIVGGGIAGLYCCFHLSKTGKGKTVHLYEGSERLGGRIQTWRINPKEFSPSGERPHAPINLSVVLDNDDALRKREDAGESPSPTPLPDLLIAEFGPMRIEPEHQPYLRKLLACLGFRQENSVSASTWSDLVPFPSYAGVEPKEPTFTLEGEEAEQTGLIDLLLLALRRVFELLYFDDKNPDNLWDSPDLNHHWRDFKSQEFLKRRLWKRSLREWINLADNIEYNKLRTDAKFRGTYLRDMGFWNLLGTVLSHMATVKIRDWGSFYHLLPENPNAAEWTIFWLRAIKSTNSLYGIRGGMDLIIHKLCRKLGFSFR
jgi:hypothetical protein